MNCDSEKLFQFLFVYSPQVFANLTLPSCSIACFKSHKETHANDVPVEKPVTQTQPVAPVPEAPAVTPSRVFGSKKPNFSILETDADLANLMGRYPNLRIQLQSVYGLTLEPPPSDPQDQQSSFGSRGRGGRGGRGSGGWRGQRGRYGQQSQQPRQSHWNQVKGDKEAADAFKRMRDREGDSEGLAEFVKLITMKFGRAEDTDGAE